MNFTFIHELNGNTFDLTPDGSNIKVDNNNKEQYILLKCEFMVKHFIKEQIESIRNGFEKLIPMSYLKDFNDHEFEYLCNGESYLAVEDWKGFTEYDGTFTYDHEVIQWFWSIMEELEQDSLRIIFQFVTGMSRLPIGGFTALRSNRGEVQNFTIRSVEYDESSPHLKSFT